MKHIYIHGLGQTAEDWRKTVEKIDEEYSDRIDLVEMMQGKEVTYRNLYKAFSDNCNKNMEPIHLCGLSLGSILALNYAIEYPQRVKSLVLIGTQYKMPKKLLQFQNAMFRFMPNAMFQQMGFGKADFLKLCKSMQEIDFSNSLKNLECPTLVICGEKDKANKKASKALVHLLRNGRFLEIRNVGHEINKEAPEKLAEVLQEFYQIIT